MNKHPIPPYRQVIQLAEQQGEAFADEVIEGHKEPAIVTVHATQLERVR